MKSASVLATHTGVGPRECLPAPICLDLPRGALTLPVTADRSHIVIAGGGVAAVELALALHDLAGRRVRMTLISPQPQFVLRTASPRRSPPECSQATSSTTFDNNSSPNPTPRETRKLASMLESQAADVEDATPSVERCPACDGRGVVAPGDELFCEGQVDAAGHEPGQRVVAPAAAVDDEQLCVHGRKAGSPPASLTFVDGTAAGRTGRARRAPAARDDVALGRCV